MSTLHHLQKSATIIFVYAAPCIDLFSRSLEANLNIH